MIELWRDDALHAQGRAVFIDVQKVQLKIECFRDLIEHNFLGVGQLRSQQLPNFGMSLLDYIDPIKRQARQLEREELEHILVACNTVHTNFVRGNGFVISEGKLIHKPDGAIGIDGKEYISLNGRYDCLILAPLPAKVHSVLIEKNRLRSDSAIELAISGPQIIKHRCSTVQCIPVRTRHRGQTIGNEINYSPYYDRTSFTCFGITGGGELIILSMFAGDAHEQSGHRYYVSQPNVGITLNEMAELLIQLGAEEAIAGGGSGDTQQYIKGQGLWVSMPRPQPQRGQVAGLRGLGAILVVKSR